MAMRSWATAVLILLSLGSTFPFFACADSSREPRRSGAKPRDGGGPRPAPGPMAGAASFPCKTHGDCVLSHRPDGQCCEVCGARALHRDAFAAVMARETEQCGVEPPECPKLECGAPKVRPVARCEEQRCVVGTEPAAAPGDIDTAGRYRVTEPLPPQGPCQADADCALTGARPGQCCTTMCPPEQLAGTKAWVAAAEALRKRRCEAWLVKSSMGCTPSPCSAKGRAEARCVQSRCVLRVAAAKSPPH